MPLAITVGTTNPPHNGIDNGQKLAYVTGTIAAIGSYVAGGDSLDWTSTLDAIKSNGYIPLQVQLWSQSSGNGHPGYTYYWRPGTTMANGRMQCMNGTTELAAGAYPAAITGDTIAFCATFVRL